VHDAASFRLLRTITLEAEVSDVYVFATKPSPGDSRAR
jgi:hypothetical protein